MEENNLPEKINVKCIFKNSEHSAVLILDEIDDLMKIEFSMNDISLIKTDKTYFEALIQLRMDLEKLDIKLLCKGCAKNVYPSGMILNMGEGRKAYTLIKNQQAKMDSLVDIFDECSIDEYAIITEQKCFYEDWFNSFN